MTSGSRPTELATKVLLSSLAYERSWWPRWGVPRKIIPATEFVKARQRRLVDAQQKAYYKLAGSKLHPGSRRPLTCQRTRAPKQWPISRIGRRLSWRTTSSTSTSHDRLSSSIVYYTNIIVLPFPIQLKKEPVGRFCDMYWGGH